MSKNKFKSWTYFATFSALDSASAKTISLASLIFSLSAAFFQVGFYEIGFLN